MARITRVLLALSACLLCVTAEKEREVDGAAAHLRQHVHGGEHDAHSDHQAILGSRKTAAEFDELPADEAKKRLAVLAKRMDLNGDDFVDMAELTKWIRRSMVALDEEEVEDRMRDMDTNGDGFVTWAEYVADSFPDQNEDNLDADDQRLLEEDRKYYKTADTDGDGRLSRNETAAFLNPENYPHMHVTLVELTMKEKDANKDGAIDLKEFLGDIHEQPNSEWHAVEKNRFLADYDTNKDGRLTGEEIRRWLVPDVGEVAAQEARHLMDGADVSKDERLSLAEVVDAHQLFVGSEATNYGEHLKKLEHEEL